jgi:alanine-glyoxylate transaminase/serine-glyoxylate transaminase/serine-pyruvate transaminase
MAQPTLGHLDPLFIEYAEETNQLLREVFQTQNVATFPVSGTGSAGMETMLSNFLEPREELIVGVCGVFGERIVDAATRLGVSVTRVDAAPGDAVDVASIIDSITPSTAAVALVHGETSVGIAQPLEGIAEAIHDHGGLFMVDCVTSLGGHPLAVDEAGIDVAFSGTQKCLNVPPGLSPFTFSERASERLERRRHAVPSWCFDLQAVRRYWGSGTRLYHHTPPINLIYALNAGLSTVHAEGLTNCWDRHGRAQAALLAGLEGLGIEPFGAAEHRLFPLTAVVPPDEVDEAAVRRELLEVSGIEVSGGLGGLAGRLWRIGTMGTGASLDSVCRVLTALVQALRSQGMDVDAGAMDRAVERWEEEAW